MNAPYRSLILEQINMNRLVGGRQPELAAHVHSQGIHLLQQTMLPRDFEIAVDHELIEPDDVVARQLRPRSAPRDAAATDGRKPDQRPSQPPHCKPSLAVCPSVGLSHPTWAAAAPAKAGNSSKRGEAPTEQSRRNRPPGQRSRAIISTGCAASHPWLGAFPRTGLSSGRRRQKGVGSRFRHDAGSHYGSFSPRNRLPTPFAASISRRGQFLDELLGACARTLGRVARSPVGVAKRGSGVDFAMMPVRTTDRSAREIDSRPLSRRASLAAARSWTASWMPMPIRGRSREAGQSPHFARFSRFNG